jgi:uncharacterized cupredoxin-like copper-binding protein
MSGVWKVGIIALMLLVPAASFSHGDTAQGSKKAGVAKKEQKPWGIAGDRSAAKRTIEVKMLDTMRFEPDTIQVRPGETVRFVVTNRGQLLHEMVIGTRQVLDEHAALMARFPNMEHDEPYMTHVLPGKTGEIVWRFNRPGEYDFACLIAGHYQAGMIGKVKVSAR